MKTRITLFATVLALTALLSSCFNSGGYRYRPDYYGSYSYRYNAPRPYVYVPTPRYNYTPPRYNYTPPRYNYNYRPKYDSRNRYNNNGRSQGRRRW